jgi:DNA-binding NtrC family response regulator
MPIEQEDRIKRQHDNINALIVENEPRTVRSLLELLARKGIGVKLATSRKAAMDSLDRNRYDLMFLSTRLGDREDHSNAFALLHEVRLNSPELPVVMLAEPAQTAAQDGRAADGHNLLRVGTQTAVHAIQAGCQDFLLKPICQEAVENLLETLLPNHQVATAATTQGAGRHLYQIVGHSPKLAQTISLAEKIAPTSVPVLVTGESGTGKELISLLIHQKSRRTLGPFVRINCAASPR